MRPAIHIQTVLDQGAQLIWPLVHDAFEEEVAAGLWLHEHLYVGAEGGRDVREVRVQVRELSTSCRNLVDAIAFGVVNVQLLYGGAEVGETSAVAQVVACSCIELSQQRQRRYRRQVRHFCITNIELEEAGAALQGRYAGARGAQEIAVAQERTLAEPVEDLLSKLVAHPEANLRLEVLSYRDYLRHLLILDPEGVLKVPQARLRVLRLKPLNANRGCELHVPGQYCRSKCLTCVGGEGGEASGAPGRTDRMRGGRCRRDEAPIEKN
mmetsp:Transcript_969/g.1741  ORF Transcript_969/g.1741 Transcript_969/m.1741 type:complete len:267 (-) Transcript_969:15-815(-)